MNFIGRKQELALLERYLGRGKSSLIVVRGRRRIGKSRLVEEFATSHRFYAFSGIAPQEKTTAQTQRDEFSSQLGKQGFPFVKVADWNDLFWLLADKTQKGRVVILLDEISWMGSKDPDFLGKLKNAWDQHFRKNPDLLLILCGSASSWIEKNILSSTGFVGRISHTITLEQLPLKDCQYFWNNINENVSAMEKFKLLSVTGGIPRYLEEIDPRLSAEENIKNMCFTKGALLVNEFDHIFSNVFLRDSDNYKKIVSLIATGDKEYIEIIDALGTGVSGRILEYLEELVLAGFISRDYTWNLKSGKDSKLSKFRLKDNYLRFYLKCIAKHKSRIERDGFDFSSVYSLPGWKTIISLQFENLVLNNRKYIWKCLGLNQSDIVAENRFFQHTTKTQPGCQIDYMVQTNFDTLYVCEIKFHKNLLTLGIIKEIQDKIKRLKRPKNFSCRPVLIHVNGVQEEVAERGYFSKIINFSEIFNESVND